MRSGGRSEVDLAEVVENLPGNDCCMERDQAE